MIRFYGQVSIRPTEDGAAGAGWQVQLDARPLRTQGGRMQIVPAKAAAQLLAAEWQEQGEKIDPEKFVLRDLADFAIDTVGPAPAAHIARLMRFAETDTLCYRADQGDPLHSHQLALWEPLLAACEARHAISLRRFSGLIHQPQEPVALGKLEARLHEADPFALAALGTLASLSASLVVALALLDGDGAPEALFAAANCEEDWQAGLWGWDTEALARRTRRLETFQQTARFLGALRG